MAGVELKSPAGAVIVVNDEEQAKVWEGYGYTRSTKRTTARASSKTRDDE